MSGTRNHKIQVAMLGATVAASAWVAWWFVEPTLWAIFIAVGIWPAYQAARRAVGATWPSLDRRMPSLVSLGLWLFLAAIIGLSAQAGIGEAKNWASGDALESLKTNFERSGLRHMVESLPMVGPKMARHIQNFDPESFAESHHVGALLFEGGGQWSREIFSAIGASIYCSLALAGLLRHGASVWPRAQDLARRILGDGLAEHLGHQAALTRSIFNSIVVLGVVETILFWAAYAQAGMGQPALLALATGAASMLPLASSLISAGVCLYLALNGDLASALSLGIFSGVVLMILDPVVRPLLAGKNTEMPYWLTTIAMLAGLQTFGLIGLFIGPQLFLLLRHLMTRLERDPKSPPNPP